VGFALWSSSPDHLSVVEANDAVGAGGDGVAVARHHHRDALGSHRPQEFDE
jgi:hypothetical protein